MLMKLLIISLLSYISFAQIKTEYLFEFGDFSKASSFTISSNGIIYVSDLGMNEIISFDTLGNKLKDIGGFGWQNGLFDQPIDVFANPLLVIVADKGNHRIQQFDRFLNFVGSFSNRNENNNEFSFGFPLSVALSNQGDIFILDGENIRILKFDMFGNFLTSFAGIDGGKFKLRRPVSLAINSQGILFVADGKSLMIYDNFGNGLNRVNFDSELRSVRIIFDEYVVVTKNSINKLTFENQSIKSDSIYIPESILNDIKSAFIYNEKLYLLLTNKILVYRIL
ncbi:MAG: NHL repeat-containing protein [Ignavibacterium sp.]|nr:NHL repeat-containing protein [Ignavibacterium sp.]